MNHLPFENKIKNPAALLPLYLKAAEEAHKAGAFSEELEAYENAGLLCYYLGKFDKEIYYTTRAIEGFSKMGKTEKVARLYGELGYRMKHANMKMAGCYMQKGIRMAEKAGLYFPLMGLYDNYGVVKEIQKDYDSALYYYNKGLALKEAHHDTAGLPYSLNNLGGLMVLKKDFRSGKAYFERALTIRSKLGDSLGMCETYLSLSDVALAEGEYRKAIEYLENTIAFASHRKLYRLLSDAYQKRASVYEESGNALLALEDEKKSRQFNDSVNNIEIRNKFAELEVRFATQEKENEVLTERLQKNSFKTWLWISGLSALLAILLAISLYLNKRFEKQVLEVRRLQDLEFERMRISRDLHDNIGAELSFITSSLDIKSAKALNEKEQQEFKAMADMGREASALLRETIWSIRLPALSLGELFDKIIQYAERRLPEGIELQKECVVDGTEELTSADALHIYRIAQESINNSVKYAACSSITIRMEKNRIVICDNGKGFDTQEPGKGYGLENIKHRAQELGLSLNITSDARGTCIELTGQA